MTVEEIVICIVNVQSICCFFSVFWISQPFVRVIQLDEGLKLEMSVFDSSTLANLSY